MTSLSWLSALPRSDDERGWLLSGSRGVSDPGAIREAGPDGPSAGNEIIGSPDSYGSAGC